MSTNNSELAARRIPRLRSHPFRAFPIFILAFLLIARFAEGAPSGNPIVLLTADNEGHVNGCESCPANRGLGGLARRAAVVTRARADAPVLLLDAGNWLVGDQSLSSRGEVIGAAYDALGYDAVNLTPKDLYWGKAQTLALAASAKFSVVSANLLDAETARPIALPYVVKTVQGLKVAILGVSEPPPGLASLPHLQAQLAGIRIRPVIDALDEWLPKARKEAQSVIVLYQGNGPGLRSLRAKLKGTGVIIGVSGLRPESAPKDGDPPVIAAERHGQSVASRRLTADPSEVTQLAVTPDLPADATLAGVVARFAPPPIASIALPAAAAPVATTRAAPAFTGPRVAARQSLQPRGLAGVGLTDQQVSDAIQRGAASLWKQVKAERAKAVGGKLGDDGGYDLLYSLALVKSDYHHRDPEFDAQLRAFLSTVRPEMLGTYGCGVLCVLIDNYGDPTFHPKLRLAVRFLLEGQGSRGSWDYNPSVSDQALVDPNSLKPVQVLGGVPLEGTNVERWKRVTAPGEDRNGDNSVTQYAVLGLDAASHSGVEIPQEAWKRVYDLYRSRQAADGGWGYVESWEMRTGSMTCAGIFAAALSKYHAGDANAVTDESVERGLGWLSAHFSAEDNPNYQGSWGYYYLYALERAGRTLGTEFIGTHEWYPLGAKFLLAKQQPSGEWPATTSESKPGVATSFALLFLSRGTVTIGEARPRGGKGTLKTALVEPPAPRVYLILDCSGSMIEEMGAKTKFDAARDAVAGIVQDLPARTQVALRAYGHRKRALDKGANEDTELLLPMAPVKPEVLAGALQRLRARGLTPLALSLREAAKDLANAGPGEVAVILLTDGGEDTFPRQDPVAATAELAQAKNVTLQIVGFDIGRDDWGAQLRAMAAAGRGRYWPATNPGELQREMRAAILHTPEGFSVTDAHDQTVATGTFGQSVSLPEGSYRFATSFAGKTFSESFWINTASTTAVLFDADKIDFTPPPGSAVPSPLPASAPAKVTALPAPNAPAAPPPATQLLRPAFCSECGKPLPPNAKFCPNCGKPVGAR